MSLTIFTDGACSGNPGPGGWAALVRYGAQEKLLSGGETHTTNNRMELLAAIVALESLKPGLTVAMTTDSRYVMDGIEKWMAGWKRKGWVTAGKQPVKNQDLWVRLDAACGRQAKVSWTWVRGHHGHPENERADAEAQRQARLHRTKQPT